MKKNGCVYFIVEEEEDFHPDLSFSIKVGITVNIKSRIKNLQTGNPNTLFVLGHISTLDYKQLERELHRKFAPSHISGEWFSLDSHMVIDVLKQYGGKILTDREQLTFLSLDKDGIPEFLGVWDWWDFDREECCPYCGSFKGMHFNEQLQSYYCVSCGTVEDWEDPIY